MFTLFIFIAVLAVLVLSHEFGHFIVARRNGIAVEEFGFGFPPRLLGIRRLKDESGKPRWQVIWRKKQLKETIAHHTGTIYSINLVPLGGFVKIKGENPDEAGANDSDSFMVKKFWQKAGVVSAGVIMNILTATILLTAGYMIGMPEISEKGGPNTYLQIVQVLPDRPAAKAGIQTGDRILEIDSIKGPSVDDFQKYVNENSQKEIKFKVEHSGEIVEKSIKPAFNQEAGRYGIGVGLVSVAFEKLPLHKALYQGIVSTGEYVLLIFSGFGMLLKQLFSGGSTEGAVAGPVGIAVLTGEAARLGIAYLIQFTALLSINLAVLNILPIPALDGGRLLFIIWGKLTNRPVNPRTEQIIHTVGFVLLMFLVVMITIKDVGSFKGPIANWWNNLF